MKILILSCNTGEGHNSTARAIKHEAESRGAAVEVWDALSFWPKATNSLICQGQEFLYKNLPVIFGIGYRFFEKFSEKENQKRARGKKQAAAFSPLAKNPSEKLHKAITEGAFDAVICTHIFASLMVTEYRKIYGREQPTYLVATDYTCSPGANFSDVEGCFIPAEGLKEEFISLGVREELIIPAGIPVREEFYNSVGKDEAKKALGLPDGKRIVLLMSGSMGCGPIEKTVEAIVSRLPEDCLLVAVCGKNEKLLSKLTELADKFSGKLHPVGFVSKISLYMDAAELVVTKAGGLSSTEAGVKNLPTVFIDAIPGLESHNRDYFVKNGYGVCESDPCGTAEAIKKLLDNETELSEMRNRMKAAFTHRSAKEIIDVVHNMAEKN